MKNLLIYLNPEKKFDNESARYIKIQIENSLKFWKKEDIVLATNFPYEHLTIKAILVPNDLCCEFEPRNSKGNGLIYLLENEILDESAWLHDLEAFQISPIALTFEKDLGLTDYGWKQKWNTGSIFLKPSAIDIFRKLQEGVYEKKAPDEPILWNLYRSNFNDIQNRCKRLNITYNLGMRYHDITIPMAEKPIKVLHFHPYRHNKLYKRFKPLLPSQLYNLFVKHK